MKDESSWIDLDKAHALLANRHLLPVTDDWMLALELSWTILETKLASGALLSRTAKPSSYRCAFRTNDEIHAIELLEGGEIVSDFWFHFSQATSENHDGLLVDERENAWRAGNRFGFIQQHGMREGGVLKGEVEHVQIHREGLPVLAWAPVLTAERDQPPLPQGPGRPRGSGGYGAADEAVVQKALELARATGEQSHNRLAKYFAQEIIGGGTEDSRVRRVALRIKARLLLQP